MTHQKQRSQEVKQRTAVRINIVDAIETDLHTDAPEYVSAVPGHC